jgi:hypothetical protein
MMGGGGGPRGGGAVLARQSAGRRTMGRGSGPRVGTQCMAALATVHRLVGGEGGPALAERHGGGGASGGVMGDDAMVTYTTVAGATMANMGIGTNMGAISPMYTAGTRTIMITTITPPMTTDANG